MFARSKPLTLPSAQEALPGRATPLSTAEQHFVLHRPLKGPYPPSSQQAMFGMGCFWGAERKFWQMGDGIFITAVGYAAGLTPNPSYREVCTGMTGHNEVVFIVYDPTIISYAHLLRVFWENHDPTQGMRQGNDVGTQYRSGIYTYSAAQAQEAHASLQTYQAMLSTKGFGAITTEIKDAPAFYFAEEDHQQYLAKNPSGYCGLGGTGVSCPIGVM
jgi:peptide-methionine (S)-S-oxide reductase